MKISVTEAKGQLTELVRRAEAGEEIILTRHGQPAARLAPAKSALDRKARRKLLEAVRASGASKAAAGPVSARSHDFLYDADGLPK
ncbi:MAG: type II toxin-antitoxin system prevent-host-death family antitoxin [Methylocystis silviterrae]|jgi:prevent-host-death family protein|uniref:type II toxin-antitoxin system Phd/YefM family antitoxin n=1 Tax=Methylocystis TaxID=133 RepID=UPI0018C28199|nr:type II toxin-antitoxin system prevent-host-death family antitoxin [Methylocystis sp. H4A]MBG0801062.1 type II toxin-antitoxin system prevent-host-death family antitoxin [Methylocystis sp. H4A]